MNKIFATEVILYTAKIIIFEKVDKGQSFVDKAQEIVAKSCTFYNRRCTRYEHMLAPQLPLMIRLSTEMPKRTYQPKKLQRSKEHGFMKRMATRTGRLVLKRRRQKGRVRLSH